MSLDAAIERSSLRGEAVRRIRAAIIYGEIAPQEIHSAPALAARMGVSVTPVREALLELTSRGMVEQVRNRGFRVVEHTRGRPRRRAGAARARRGADAHPPRRRAGRRRTPTTCAGSSTRASPPPAGATRPRSWTSTARFHLGLLARAGNPRIVDVVDQVLDHLRLARFAEEHDALVEVAEGHRAILDAIVAGDQDAVARAANEHLALTRTAWERSLSRTRPALGRTKRFLKPSFRKRPKDHKPE